MVIADAEAILIRRCRDIMAVLRTLLPDGTQLGMDFVTQDGTNPDLADPIGFAIRLCGGPTDNPGRPTDLELATLNPSSADMLLDAAELRLLESLLTAASARTDLELGDDKYKWSQAALALQKIVDRMTTDFSDRYLDGVRMVDIGTILSTYTTPGHSRFQLAWPNPGPQPYPGGPTWP